jgi:hypothetical protein
VKLLCDLNYQALNPTVRGVFNETEKWILQRQSPYEFQALELIRGQQNEAPRSSEVHR